MSLSNETLEGTPAGFFRGPIECVEIRPDDVRCVEKTEFLRNSDVPFKVGDTFSYEFAGSAKDTDIYTVEGIERINGSDCFVVRREYSFTGPSDTIHTTERVWYDKDTGRIKKDELSESDILYGEVAESLSSDTLFFAQWMLSLTDDFKLEIRYNDTYATAGVLSYEVVGREKIDGRNCFKVKVNDRYLWVDAEKRILIKSSTGEQLVA